MGGKLGTESYALVLDDQVVFTSYSKIQCITQAGRLIKNKQPGRRMRLIKVVPVQSHRDTIVFAWQNSGKGWRVQSLSEAA